MSSVYPVNLMAPRSRSKRVVKGALFFAVVVALLMTAFLASNLSQYMVGDPYVSCKQGTKGLDCYVKTK